MKELIRADEWNPMLFTKEIQILSVLSDHAHILNYKEAYINSTHFYLCTDLCSGGELFDKVKKLKHFSEKQCAEVMTSILTAIQYIHSKKIVHRDLKPENIVFKSNERDAEITIIDFGDAEQVKGDQHIYTDFVGTPFYLAPESVRHRCGWELYKSDMWSIGVIAYVLLTGRPPFGGRNNREILAKILKSRVHWPSNIRLSQAAKSFIHELLQKDPRKRMSATEALNHKWIRKEAVLNNRHLGDALIKSLAKFQSACRLKKLIVTAIVKDMSEEDKQVIARAFHELDVNGDGYLTKGELKKYLLATGALNRNAASLRADQLINGMDMDGDGQIDLNEWLHGKTAEKLASDRKLIDMQFEKILSASAESVNDDDDFKGSDAVPPMDERQTITTDLIHKSFADIVSEEELKEIIDEIDENNDGVVDLEEFRNAMKQITIRE